MIPEMKEYKLETKLHFYYLSGDKKCLGKKIKIGNTKKVFK